MQNPADIAGSKAAALAGLRAVLAEKFPQPPVRTGDAFSVTVGASSNRVAQVPLRRGAITEASGSSGSGALFLEAMLNATATARTMMALVDGASGFDPAAEDSRLKRLLWVLCKDAQSAIKVADLLLRDGNLPLVVLDLQMNPPTELRRIPSSTWYRFQRIMEQSTAAFVVLTAKPMVNSAAERLWLHNRWSLRAMRQRRNELPLQVEQVHRGFGTSMDRQTDRQIA
jgi:hypothetical protein